ncbi:hypothetical protein NC651_031811 [Populus alba x Populus x berolinensis]|nr:hypothetical protein NC651_031811 [Populus alba x Populus x berolinensis]
MNIKCLKSIPLTSLSFSVFPVTRAVIASSSPSFLVSLDATGDTLFTISLTRDLGVDSRMGFGSGGGVNSGFIVEFKDLKRNCGLEVHRILTESESRCKWRSQNKRDDVSVWWNKNIIVKKHPAMPLQAGRRFKCRALSYDIDCRICWLAKLQILPAYQLRESVNQMLGA